jgi:hypothetical protein
MTETCNHCDFTYETIEQLIAHMNATHTKCPCGTVWNNKDVDEDYEYTLCQECFKREGGKEFLVSIDGEIEEKTDKLLS